MMNHTMTAASREAPLPGTSIDPFYPDEDGRSLADTQFHTKALFDTREQLQRFFSDEPDVYVATRLIMYYKKGDPKARKDPDILVARGVASSTRPAD